MECCYIYIYIYLLIYIYISCETEVVYICLHCMPNVVKKCVTHAHFARKNASFEFLMKPLVLGMS